MPKYQIIRADLMGTPPIDGLVLDDPAVAAQLARRLSREMNEKLMVKAIVDDAWRKREEGRIVNGQYRPLPWVMMDWWRSDMARMIHKDHFAHPSIERPGFLAYTKSPEDGSKDKQTIVRPGAYLKQYFSRVLSVYGQSERGLVDLFMRAHGPLDIKFATTDEEIISVYEHGPETCMMGKHWPGDGRNPAHVYNAGDLQVAYLGKLEKATARTLVWPEKKTFSRVYGDIARITTALERMGYKWGAPIGAKIKKIKAREVKLDPNRGPPVHCFVVPYVDKKNMRGGGHLSVIEKDDHLVICEEGLPGSHHCSTADGYSGPYVPRVDEYPIFTCDECGAPGHRALLTVHLDGEANEQASWCGKCVQRYARQCNYSGNYYHKGNVEFTEVGGYWWTEHFAEMYAARCEETDTLHPSDNLVKLFNADNNPRMVCQDYITDQGGCFRSDLNNKFYLKRHKVHINIENGADIKQHPVNTWDVFGRPCRQVVVVGYYCGKPELTYRAFQCDGCDQYGLIEQRHQSLNDDRLFCLGCAVHIKTNNKIPVSPSRQVFEAQRAQRILPLIAAE